MLKTKTAQNYQLNGVNYSAILFTKIDDIFFRLRDKMVVIYVVKGYEATEAHPTTGEDVLKQVVIGNVPFKFTQAELKDLIDNAGINFNSTGDNLLLDDMAAAGVEIISSLITADSSRFFGVDAAEWE